MTRIQEIPKLERIQVSCIPPNWLLGAILIVYLVGFQCFANTVKAELGKWQVVQSYMDEESVWRGMNKDGVPPDISEAVAAAHAIIETTDHPKTIEAAIFLMTYLRDSESPSASEDVQKGERALVEHIGPDWTVVEGFHAALGEIIAENDTLDISRYEKLRRVDSTFFQHLAAAVAVLETEDHPLTREAAEFLVSAYFPGRCYTKYVVMGAETLRDRYPQYDDWGTTLTFLDSCRVVSNEATPAIDHFYLSMATSSIDKAVQGIARYFLTVGLQRSINAPSISKNERVKLRITALDWATGLSDGIEEVELFVRYGPDSRPGNLPLEQVERKLIRNIKHTTVGARVPEITGTRLNGNDERLIEYLGKTVLIDFWATWCGPCIAEFPELRKLWRSLPKDRFSLLSISVDEHLSTVTKFLEEEPMPWSNWHVGNVSDVPKSLDVRSYPTYILLDSQGVILARSGSLNDSFISTVKDSVDSTTQQH